MGTSGLEIASMTNLELGPRFAEVCSIVRNKNIFLILVTNKTYIDRVSRLQETTIIFITRSKDHWKKRTNKFLVFVKVQKNGTNNQLIKVPPRADFSFTLILYDI